MHKTLEPKNSVQAPNIQNVQKKIFGEQYKERLDANFSKIKKYIIDNEPYIPNYNEKIASPIEICDIIIAKSPITFTELNKLPDNTKKCISDILL